MNVHELLTNEFSEGGDINIDDSDLKFNIIQKDISGIIIKGFIDKNSINKERRIFSGFGSVAVIDRQGDYLPMDEFKPVMEKLMARGAPVTDSHSNHVVGKIVDYTYKPTESGELGLYLTAEIYNHYPSDEETWHKIQDGEYTGFSLGGKAGTKTPTCTNIGCYNILGDIEAWEFSIVERPANQLANIDKVNKLAKASNVAEEVINSIMKERVYIKNPSEVPEGMKVQEGKRGGLYYESESQINNRESHQIDSEKDDFLYSLKQDYIIDFDKKDLQIFENFYENYPKEVRDNHSFVAVIADISNNLPKEVVYSISKIPVQFTSEDKYNQEARGYWAAVYDHDNRYIALNKEIYQSLSRDYYTQEQYHRVLLHEYGHKLVYGDIISEQFMFALWDTKERVSEQSKLDYNENAADSFAAFLMSLNDEMYAKDLKEEFPKTYQLWTNWLKEVNYEV